MVRRILKAKICKACNKEFIPTGSYQFYCKECRPVVYRERHRILQSKWSKEHFDKAKEIMYRWRKKNPDKVREIWKRTYIKNFDKIKEHKRQWQQANPEKVKTEKARRRNLGFEPLNKWFENSVAHHVNNYYVIYIPVEMHEKNPHKQDDWDSMLKINKLAFQYLIDNG